MMDLYKIICCPNCGSKLEISNNKITNINPSLKAIASLDSNSKTLHNLLCVKCKMNYIVKDEIPVLLTQRI